MAAKPKLPAVRNQQNIAACAALGLVWWSEHQQTHHLWAADYEGRLHEVRIDRKGGTAAHVCSGGVTYQYNPPVYDRRMLTGYRDPLRWRDHPRACPESIARTGEWSTPGTVDDLLMLFGADLFAVAA